MAKAEISVLAESRSSNFVAPVPERLTTHQTAAALVALLNGAGQIPCISDLRSIVRRGLRASRIAAKGGHRHG